MEQAVKQKAKVNKTNTIVVLAFILVILWQAGYLGSIIKSLTGSTPAKAYRVTVIEPAEGAEIKAAGGELKASFRNAAIDNATIENVTLRNLGGKGKCLVDLRLPAALAPGDYVEITASGCAAQDAVEGDKFTLEFEITGKTTNRAKLYYENPWVMAYQTNANADAPETRNPANFVSRGLIYGTYG